MTLRVKKKSQVILAYNKNKNKISELMRLKSETIILFLEENLAAVFTTLESPM